MIQVYIADEMGSERLALRLMLAELNMEVSGEAENWSSALTQTSILHSDILIVEWNLLPAMPGMAFDELRKACLKALVIILIGNLMDHRQAARSFGADVFISKGDLPERVAEHLLAAAARTNI